MHRQLLHRTRNRTEGFTLVELMVAVVVMAIVTTQLLLSFSHQNTTSLAQERAVEVQENARIVNDLILADLRMSGFMVPQFVAVASVDGGTNGSDVLCISDSTIVDESLLPNASSRFPGAEISTAFSGATSSVSVTSMDIDSDGDDDFSVGGGLLIGTGTAGHCALITNISGSTISFTPATVGGFSATTDDAVVPALVYAVTGTTLRRNNIVLSDQIEDLQVRFGVDTNSSGAFEAGEFPIDDLTGEDFERIELVEVSVTARDLRGEEGFDGQFAAVANRVAGSADNFKRRRITGDMQLRNVQ